MGMSLREPVSAVGSGMTAPSRGDPGATTMLDALSAHVAVLDAELRIVALNAAWQRFAAAEGSDMKALVGQHYVAACRTTRWGGRQYAALATALHAVANGKRPKVEIEKRLPGKAGTAPRWFRVSITRLAGDSGQIVVAHDEITDLRHLADKLRRLSGRLLVSQDEERRRIARELHDSTAQQLLGATLALRGARRLIPRLGKQGAAMLAEAETLIAQSQQEIRAVSALLHPPLLDEVGLDAALEWLAKRFARLSGLSIDVEATPVPADLPEGHAIALFRVVQEALSNVHRHAGASGVAIRLTMAGNGRRRQLQVSVADDGRGPPSAAMMDGHEPAGVGLIGMRERLAQLGGQLAVGPSESGGTLVTATLPLG